MEDEDDEGSGESFYENEEADSSGVDDEEPGARRVVEASLMQGRRGRRPGLQSPQRQCHWGLRAASMPTLGTLRGGGAGNTARKARLKKRDGGNSSVKKKRGRRGGRRVQAERQRREARPLASDVSRDVRRLARIAATVAAARQSGEGITEGVGAGVDPALRAAFLAVHGPDAPADGPQAFLDKVRPFPGADRSARPACAHRSARWPLQRGG